VDATTPLFIRENTIIPLSTLADGDNTWDGATVEFLVAIPDGNSSCSYRYHWDDGISYDYLAGGRSELEIVVQPGNGLRSIEITARHLQSGYGTLHPTFVLFGTDWTGIGTVDRLEVTWCCEEGTIRLAGVEQQVTRFVAGSRAAAAGNDIKP
jgi:hypothetical protein